MAITRDKLHVDEEFGLQLKDFRNQYQIKAKDVAVYMGKSAAYISKLEKGEIHQIDKKEFTKLVNFISSSEDGYALFCERIIGTMNLEALERSTIASNFDWLDRLLPIPDEYCNYVKKKLNECKLTLSMIADYINRNDDLDEKFLEEQKIDKLTCEKNIWIPYYEADSNSNRRNYILVEITEEQIADIINQNIRKTSYLFLYVILYHIYKMQELNKKIFLEEGTRTNLKRKTTNKLNEFKIYTLSDKTKMMSQTSNEAEREEVLSSFDIKNQRLVNELMNGILYLSEQDVEYTNSKLEGILKNLREDPSFSFAYMALSLDKLFKLPFKVKKDFLESVETLIEKCSNAVGNEIERF